MLKRLLCKSDVKSPRLNVTLEPKPAGVDLTIRLPDATCEHVIAEGILVLLGDENRASKIHKYFSTNDYVITVRDLEYWSTYVLKVIVRCIEGKDVFMRQNIFTGFGCKYAFNVFIFF